MLVAEMLQIQGGLKVLDACSAPGGKATHIAEKMQNQGEIRAHDLHKKKIKLIDEKAATLGLTNIVASQADARNLQKIYQEETFDRILVDAPCSGLGVIRGKPDIKYNKTEKDIQRLVAIQLDILETVAPLLKKDGLLLYITCTVDIEENEAVVKHFLKKHSDFQVDHTFFDELPSNIQESRSEERTSELQSRGHLVCRLLLEEKKKSVEFGQAQLNHRQRPDPQPN